MSNEQPSTSGGANELLNMDDADITLDIKNEEDEIARLELPAGELDTNPETDSTTTGAPPPDDERIAKIEFHCNSCDMHEMVHYFGKTPPFVFGVKFREDTYVMRDPFQPPPPRWRPKAEFFVALGAKCVQCQRAVCKDADCSLHYTATYCLGCAERHVKSFPVEVQSKLRRQLVNKQ